MNKEVDILVIGGGAAGFFSAIHAKATKPKASVVILEKSNKLLSKVLVSGGGRCNVSHNQPDLSELLKAYPRGKSLLKWVLRKWGVVNTVRWFESHHVSLKTEEDGRMFPSTNDSSTIANALLVAAQNLGIEIITGNGLESLLPIENEFVVQTKEFEFAAKSVIIACGGFPKIEQYQFISNLGIQIEPPVPSLFTFNIPDTQLYDLKGVSTPWGRVKVSGLDGWFEGPIMITHWGLSGPAILKASAFLARELHSSAYKYTVLTDWTGMGEEAAREHYISYLLMHSARQISNANPFEFPRKLWEFLLDRAEIKPDKLCRDLSKSEKNKLLEVCVRSEYKANGKTTFKEEFVTAGGVALSEIDANTMQSKKIPNLYFAGEIIDMDGITGGYNFQAAWATGYIAGSSSVKR